MRSKRKLIFTQYYRDYLFACSILGVHPKTGARHIWRFAHMVGMPRGATLYAYRPDAWNTDTHEELVRIERIVGVKLEFIPSRQTRDE